MVAAVSLNHLYGFWAALDVSTRVLGLLWWVTIGSGLVVLSRKYLRTVILLFLFSFFVGYSTGPFLEPPADPLEHLRRVEDTVCGRDASYLPRENSGLWHYSMMGLLLCDKSGERDVATIFRQIDLTHGLLWGILMASLFVLGRAAGMPGRWALMSCLICFLFFGTNRFSYFKYYSFAPSFTSLLIFWLWAAAFFFRRSWQAILSGLLIAIGSLPVIWINHQQEAVFLAFVVLIWILLNSCFAVQEWLQGRGGGVCSKSRFQVLLQVSGLAAMFLIFFVLPQSKAFRQALASLFVKNQWANNQHLVFSWQGVHLCGMIWSDRITDTLGTISVAMLVLAIPYFWPGLIRNDFEKKFRIAALAFLPFWGYCVPLFHYIWTANVYSFEYWRLCYSSMFWLFFADCMRGFESWFYLYCTRLQRKLSDSTGTS